MSPPLCIAHTSMRGHLPEARNRGGENCASHQPHDDRVVSQKRAGRETHHFAPCVVSLRCAIRGGEDHSEVHNVPVDGVLFFATVAAVYGVLVLLVSARLTGTRLLATLMVALVPAVLLMLLLPEGSDVRTLGIPMTTGTFAALVRGMKGFDSPLGRAPAN